ncbi:MAG: hypothetical protein ACLUOS_02470 [Odoribacter splanchnicus]
MGGTALEGLLSGEKENVIVVLASDETNIDGILAYVQFGAKQPDFAKH